MSQFYKAYDYNTNYEPDLSWGNKCSIGSTESFTDTPYYYENTKKDNVIKIILYSYLGSFLIPLILLALLLIIFVSGSD